MTTYISPGRVYPYDSGGALTNGDLQQICQWIHDAIVSCGIVDTADTGATDLSTITIGSSNTDRGWRMYRFNDSSQGAEPIFFKVFYGMGSAGARWRLRVAVGTGTDGAGTLTGPQTGFAIVGGSAVLEYQTAGESRNDFSCHTEGFFGVCIQPNDGDLTGNRYPYQTFAIARSRDAATGNMDGDAVILYTCSQFPDNAPNVSMFTRDGLYSYTEDYSVCMAVGNYTGTNEAGDQMIWPLWWGDYAVRQIPGLAAIPKANFPNPPTTFSAAPFPNWGSHTYLSFGYFGPVVESTGEVSTIRLAMLWE